MKPQKLFAIRYRRRVFDENFDERARRRFHDDKHGYRKPDAITKRKFQRCFHFVVLFRAVVVCDERRSPLCKSRYHTERHGIDFFVTPIAASAVSPYPIISEFSTRFDTADNIV